MTDSHKRKQQSLDEDVSTVAVKRTKVPDSMTMYDLIAEKIMDSSPTFCLDVARIIAHYVLIDAVLHWNDMGVPVLADFLRMDHHSGDHFLCRLYPLGPIPVSLSRDPITYIGWCICVNGKRGNNLIALFQGYVLRGAFDSHSHPPTAFPPHNDSPVSYIHSDPVRKLYQTTEIKTTEEERASIRAGEPRQTRLNGWLGPCAGIVNPCCAGVIASGLPFGPWVLYSEGTKAQRVKDSTGWSSERLGDGVHVRLFHRDKGSSHQTMVSRDEFVHFDANALDAMVRGPVVFYDAAQSATLLVENINPAQYMPDLIVGASLPAALRRREDIKDPLRLVRRTPIGIFAEQSFYGVTMVASQDLPSGELRGPFLTKGSCFPNTVSPTVQAMIGPIRCPGCGCTEDELLALANEARKTYCLT